ncbi:MAG: carbohydrate kinase family protein [Patescibacteria group bacterium]
MYDVITIGTATRDIFLTSPFFKVVSDEAHLKKIGFPTGEAQCFALGGKIEIDKPIFITGGGATNAAVTFARQGLKAAALIKVGKDSAGEEIINELKKEKISVLTLYPIPYTLNPNNNGTAYSTILLAPNGERTILVYRGASESLSINEISFDKFNSKWAYIVPGKISYDVIKEIIDYLHQQKILIAFNPSKYFIELGLEKLKPILEKTKAVILNREEAAYLTDIDYDKEKAIFKKLDAIVAGIAVMTDGPNGVSVSDGFNIYRAGTFGEKKLVDRTGSGDAFGSGFVAGLIHEQETCEKGLCKVNNIEYAVRLGSANATSVIEYIGAKKGILTKEEFEISERWRNLKIDIIRN